MIDESRVPSFETEPAALETAPVPLELRRPREVSLFWRTFFLLSLLLVGCIVAWLQTFRALEFEPRTLQSAQQLASLVNLSRAALVHSDSIARVSLVKTMADEEKVRIAPREPGDKFRLYDADPLSRTVSAQLGARLGPDTVVAREVNGTPGLWIGFSIDGDPYWLQADPSRVELVTGKTWVIWLGTAAVLSLMGAALIARLINRPLQKLSFAASRVRDGDFNSSRLNETVATSEIRQVNIGFNRMAQRLSKIEQDRALMLAGISHDLRTPLARLRLETEMSVADPEAREHMAADIEQVNAIIDKFLDYARPDHIEAQRVSLNEVIEAAVFALGNAPDVRSDQHSARHLGHGRRGRTQPGVLQPAGERRCATDATRSPGVAEIDIGAKPKDDWVLVKLRDHGSGRAPRHAGPADPAVLPRAMRRAAPATGTGLGLAIVERAIARMGGRFALANSSSGGLAAHIKLPDQAKRPDSDRCRRTSSATARASIDKPLPHRAQLLGGLGLHVDLIHRQAQRLRDALAHGRDVRTQLGRLRDHGAVDVADLEAGLAHAARDLGQQHQRVRAFETRVGVGEMAPDVAQRGRTQQRVGDGVQQHVGIRMAEQALVWGICHPTDDQRATGHQRMHVPALTDAKRKVPAWRDRGHGRLFRMASASAKSSG